LNQLIQKSITNFHSYTPIRWVQDDTRDYYVEFIQNNKSDPSAQIACIKSKGTKPKNVVDHQNISLPYPTYPESVDKIKVACVMHQMSHCIGLFHQHDIAKDKKAVVKCGGKNISSYTTGVEFGELDSTSIMNYGHGEKKIYTKGKELRQLADNANFFSKND